MTVEPPLKYIKGFICSLEIEMAAILVKLVLDILTLLLENSSKDILGMLNVILAREDLFIVKKELSMYMRGAIVLDILS